MMGVIEVAFGVGHEAEDPTGGIAQTGSVRHGDRVTGRVLSIFRLCVAGKLHPLRSFAVTERGTLPMARTSVLAVRDVFDDMLATWGSPAQTCYVGLGPGFIEKNEFIAATPSICFIKPYAAVVYIKATLACRRCTAVIVAEWAFVQSIA